MSSAAVVIGALSFQILRITAILKLTHFIMETPKTITSKQCQPRSDAAECSIWSGSTLFALTTGISIKHSNNKNQLDTLLLEIDWSKELW